MSQVKVPIIPNGFSNSRKTVDYDHLSIFRHSIVLPFETQVYLLSSTLSLNPFAGYSVYSGFDLLSGYDAHILHPKSRDLTAFQMPLGLLHYTCLPQGFTNSVAEFQNCTTFILQDKIPHIVAIMIDDMMRR